MSKLAELGLKQFSWWPDWRGECVAIIASGPSAKQANIELLRDRIHVIVVNMGYKLCPWAEVLYVCDGAWWKVNKEALKFAGLKLSHDQTACRDYRDLHKIQIEKAGSDDLMLEKPSYIGAGGNSGFQAMNLAVQFGATGIMLIGFDMRLDKGAHWHPNYRAPLSNPQESNVKRWRKAVEGIAPKLRALDVDVVNCSPDSALTSYPKMTIEQAMERWGL